MKLIDRNTLERRRVFCTLLFGIATGLSIANVLFLLEFDVFQFFCSLLIILCIISGYFICYPVMKWELLIHKKSIANGSRHRKRMRGDY